MKRIAAFIVLFLMMFVLSGLPFHKKCVKCLEERKKDKTVMVPIGIARRDFGTPNIHKDGKVYATYKCEYGHTFLVCLED